MRRDTFLALGVVILVLAALAAKSFLVPLPPVRAHSAPGQFDAARAKGRLAYILGDQRPHPADSIGDDLVRARLVATIQQIGLKPIVRDQFACNDFQKARLVACARVRNVIAILGPKTGKALMLSAHYDSVPVGPGASDDGIGIATLLEVGSILKDRPLKRPVILLFNEGEEIGLIGARAFLADPLSRNVDSLLNFEARGVTGPATMFETSQPNGAAIAAYASSVSRPNASSLATDVARLIPNGTDVMTYKERGWLTLNSAIIGNETRYHSSGDDLAGLDPASLQSMGDEALALASNLSVGTPKAQGERIFFDLSQRTFLQIPLIVGVVWLLIMLVIFGAVSWRRGTIFRGTGAVLGAIVASGALAWVALAVMGFLRAGTYWRAQPEVTFIAIYATILWVEVVVLRILAGKVETAGLRAACWFLFLLLGGALALIAPGGIIYFLIPPTVVLVGMIAARWYGPAERFGGLAGLVLLYLTWGELLGALETIFSPGPLWNVVPVAAIAIAPALVEAHGLFTGASRRVTLAGSALIALIAWVVVGAVPAYSKDHQQRFTIEHVTEFPSGRSSWSVINDGAALPKAYSSLGSWRRGKFDFSDRRRWITSAPLASGVRPPSIQLLESVRNATERTIRLRLVSNGAERLVLIAPADAHLRSAGFGAFVRPIGDDETTDDFTISCTGRSCDGAVLTLDLNSAKALKLTIIGSRNGLPASAARLVRARPEFARPQYVPDETVAVAHVNL